MYSAALNVTASQVAHTSRTAALKWEHVAFIILVLRYIVLGRARDETAQSIFKIVYYQVAAAALITISSWVLIWFLPLVNFIYNYCLAQRAFKLRHHHIIIVAHY
jgi:hypothetical protein